MKKSLLVFTFLVSVSLFAVASSDGASIYHKCKSCHGENGEKAALGVGTPLKGQSTTDIITKLKGYKDGSYGGSKKKTMSFQANKLSDEQISTVANYISKF